MIPMVEKVSAVTFRVTNMRASVQFYRDVLGMELIYGGEGSYFSSLRAREAESAILNLEKGDPPARPQDGAWGERYFHMPDPDGHELPFARPLRWAIYMVG